MFTFLCLIIYLQELVTQEKATPLLNAPSIVSSSNDLKKNSEDLSVAASHLQFSGSILDAPVPSSSLDICSTLQFSIQDLRKRRQQRLSIMQSSCHTSGSVKMRRSTMLQVSFSWH